MDHIIITNYEILSHALTTKKKEIKLHNLLQSHIYIDRKNPQKKGKCI